MTLKLPVNLDQGSQHDISSVLDGHSLSLLDIANGSAVNAQLLLLKGQAYAVDLVCPGSLPEQIANCIICLSSFVAHGSEHPE